MTNYKRHKGSPEPIMRWLRVWLKTKKRGREKNLSTQKCGGLSRKLVEGQDGTGQGGARRANKGKSFLLTLAGLTNSNKKAVGGW